MTIAPTMFALILVTRAVGQSPCVAPPPSTGAFSVVVSGNVVTLSWPVAPGADRYFIRAGVGSGSREFGPFDMGLASSVTLAAPPGTYYAVLNASNACGASGDSNEVVVTVQQPAPAVFSIELPVTAPDVARESFGLNAFGIHFGGTGAGGHGLDGHPGWDIEYRLGGVVRAAADGVVQSRFADSFTPGRVTVQIHHQRGTLAFRTVYTNITDVLSAIEPGGAVVAGQPIGFAGSQSATIGTERVTYAMTHFQVDDFRRNEGLTNPNAVNPEEFLSASGVSLFHAIWRTAAYNVEMTEPFAGNSRTVAFPIVRTWTREVGSLAAHIVFTRRDAGSSVHDYVLYETSGAPFEQGTASVQVTRSSVHIDLQPIGGGSPRRGLLDIVGGTMRIDYGAPGAPRPIDLTHASTYRTPPY